MRTFKFEGTCWHCQTAIRSGDSGGTWRHVHKPAGEKHQAMPSGVIREI